MKNIINILTIIGLLTMIGGVMYDEKIVVTGFLIVGISSFLGAMTD